MKLYRQLKRFGSKVAVGTGLALGSGYAMAQADPWYTTAANYISGDGVTAAEAIIGAMAVLVVILMVAGKFGMRTRG